MSFENKRNIINTAERKKIQKDLDTLKIVTSVIQNYKKNKNVPAMSMLHLVELSETLDDILLKDGLPEKRLKEIKKEINEN